MSILLIDHDKLKVSSNELEHMLNELLSLVLYGRSIPICLFFPQQPQLQLFPPPQELSPPSSSTPPLPPLDLTPPTQHTSELDISDNFSDPNYDDTDHDYGIPFEWLPSRPMVNYGNDRELEEDYRIGWEWLE